MSSVASVVEVKLHTVGLNALHGLAQYAGLHGYFLIMAMQFSVAHCRGPGGVGRVE
jgi:hypothetical protein